MTKQLRPLMIGVVGDSAAGKTTLTHGIAQILGGDATVVCLDDYHKYDRQQRKELKITALSPECNYIDIMEQHVNLLRLGQPILKPVYNHSTGTLDRPEYVVPGKLVIVEGLLSLHTPALQRCFDVSIYLDPDERLRRRWKVARDTHKRGYKPEEVLAAIERRMPDSERYIWPQKKAADLIVRFWPPYGYFDENVDNRYLNVRIFQRHTLPRPDLTAVLDHSHNGRRDAISLEKDVWSGGQPVDILDIDGAISREKAAELEQVIWDQLEFTEELHPELLGAFQEGARERHSNPLALTQLLIVYYLLTVRKHRPIVTP